MADTHDTPPPTAKYRYTLTIIGNSHGEIVGELVAATRGGYLIDSDYYERDEFLAYGGRKTSRLEHTNPSQTPETYAAELDQWSASRKAARREVGADG
jgi:hypothetical protein